MTVSIEALGIDRLSVRERLDLIEQIWDSLPEQVMPPRRCQRGTSPNSPKGGASRCRSGRRQAVARSAGAVRASVVSLPVILRPAADADIQATYDGLEQARAGLGDRFVACVRQVYLTGGARDRTTSRSLLSWRAQYGSGLHENAGLSA